MISVSDLGKMNEFIIQLDPNSTDTTDKFKVILNN